MHGLLKEVGKAIVMRESVKHPGRRSRLWNYEDVYHVLKYNKGTEVVEAIKFEAHRHIEDLYLSSVCFKNMTNLRHLHITIGTKSRLHLLEGLECLSDKLRYLYWDSFPLESLPPTFCGEWLVQLTMKYSKLKKLWDGTQRLDNLMILNLDDSEDLIETPDLSRAPNLQIVSLSNCKSLCRLHPSIFSIPKLTELRLNGCKEIESLKHNINLKSLQILNLSDSSVAKFSATSEEMMELSLRGAVAQEFSSLMLCNKKLTQLHLPGCTQINTSSLMFIFDGTPSLKKLNLSKCRYLEILPDNIQNCSMLEILDLDDCRKLKSLPKLPASLQSFTARNCIHLETNSIQQSILENMLHKLRSHENMLRDKSHSWSNRKMPTYEMDLCFFPGGEVPSEFNFHTAKASIVIPPIPKYGLCGFVICIILSTGVNISTVGYWEGELLCTIYQRTEEVDHEKWYWSGVLISDHVLLGCIGCYNSDWVKMWSESRGDHYNLSFHFNCTNHYGKTATWIKRCGVIPVYDSKHNFVLDSRISGVEIVEIQSNAQLSDKSDDIKVLDDCHRHSKFEINESKPQKIGAENEVDQQHLIIPQTENTELNVKSSCSRSIGLLLKHILEESKRLFLKRR